MLNKQEHLHHIAGLILRDFYQLHDPGLKRSRMKTQAWNLLRNKNKLTFPFTPSKNQEDDTRKLRIPATPLRKYKRAAIPDGPFISALVRIIFHASVFFSLSR
jgi:hypothetical protein